MQKNVVSRIMRKHAGMIAIIVLCSVASALAFVLEVGFDLCLSRAAFLSYGLLWTVLLLPLLLREPLRAKAAVHTVFLLVLVALYIVPWSSRKAFLRDFARVQVGMTETEVESIMDKYMKGTGWPSKIDSSPRVNTLTDVGIGYTLKTVESATGELEIRDSLVYRHSNAPWYNSDWGVIRFESGRVADKVFMPD